MKWKRATWLVAICLIVALVIDLFLWTLRMSEVAGYFLGGDLRHLHEWLHLLQLLLRWLPMIAFFLVLHQKQRTS